MDDGDRAQASLDAFIAGALLEHHRRQPHGPGADECEFCGEEIPEARKKAQPSCTTCIECQTKLEINSRRHL
jgi:phage/conjugal plasmid C-4 type zinc finger TraR family protein